MRCTRIERSRRERGITMVEVLIVLAIVFLLASIAIPAYAHALRQSRESALVSDCRQLFDALTRYYVDNGNYPSESELDTETLSPLSTDEYLAEVGPFTQKLVGNKLYYYLAPDVDGDDQQFIVVTRHKDDPDIIVAAVSTDVVSDDGSWTEGVFIITEQDLADAGI